MVDRGSPADRADDGPEHGVEFSQAVIGRGARNHEHLIWRFIIWRFIKRSPQIAEYVVGDGADAARGGLARFGEETRLAGNGVRGLDHEMRRIADRGKRLAEQ